MVHGQGRRLGVGLVTASAVLWSTAGLFVRMADLDTWTLVAWRSLFTALTLGAAVALRKPASPSAGAGRLGLPAGVTVLLTVVSTVSYVVALRLTTVANVMAVFATLPFLATGIAYLVLGERVTARFAVAGGTALLAVVVMAGAVATPRDLLGIVAALAMTAGFAAQLVHTKRHPSLDAPLLVAAAALACIPMAVPFASGAVPGPTQLLACALYGALTTGLGYVLGLEGGRLIPSGEAGLISLLEVVLGPLWVWAFYAERPPGVVAACGGVVLLAVAWYLATAGSTGAGQPAVAPGRTPAGRPRRDGPP